MFDSTFKQVNISQFETYQCVTRYRLVQWTILKIQYLKYQISQNLKNEIYD